ncbi:MAG: IdeS/Mac family cysteine endopeptidase, partial [Akkermansia sp.]
PLNMRFPHFIVPLFVGFSLSAPVDAAAIFAQGVTEQSGWYDTNKTWNDDNNMCWAAATSNILQWWQDKGTYVPAGTPNGKIPGDPTQSVILQNFRDNWGDVGGSAELGFRWYLGGGQFTTTPNGLNDPNSGKYWEDYIKSIGYDQTPTDPFQKYLPVIQHNHSYTPNFASGFVTTMIDLFKGGAGVTLGILSGSSGHAITLWGIDYDQNNNLTALYITDSDDGTTEIKRIEASIMQTEAAEDNGDKIFLTGYGNGSYFINHYTALSLPFAIPEPSSVLLSLLGGSLLCLSRRRR